MVLTCGMRIGLKADFFQQFANIDLANEWLQRLGTVEKDDMVAILQEVSARRGES